MEAAGSLQILLWQEALSCRVGDAIAQLTKSLSHLLRLLRGCKADFFGKQLDATGTKRFMLLKKGIERDTARTMEWDAVAFCAGGIPTGREMGERRSGCPAAASRARRTSLKGSLSELLTKLAMQNSCASGPL